MIAVCVRETLVLFSPKRVLVCFPEFDPLALPTASVGESFCIRMFHGTYLHLADLVLQRSMVF